MDPHTLNPFQPAAATFARAQRVTLWLFAAYALFVGTVAVAGFLFHAYPVDSQRYQR